MNYWLITWWNRSTNQRNRSKPTLRDAIERDWNEEKAQEKHKKSTRKDTLTHPNLGFAKFGDGHCQKGGDGGGVFLADAVDAAPVEAKQKNHATREKKDSLDEKERKKERIDHKSVMNSLTNWNQFLQLIIII